VPHGFVAAGREFNPYQRVAVCSVDTLRRRLARLTPPDLIIWDEAHHVSAKTWGSVYAWAGQQCRHVGLSATPARLDGRGLDKYFGALVHGPSTGELIARHFLSGYRAFAPSTPDLSRVHTRAGDYASGELAGVMDTGQIAGNIVGTYQRLANGKRAIYYAVSIDHSRHLVGAFRAAGVDATHLDGNSSAAERTQAARDCAEGRVKVLCNVDLFGEGFDLAASAGRDVNIEAVGLCRPTQSLTLHLQQIGRALRPKQSPAIILDHAGNLMRHGLPDDERTWTLEGITRQQRQADNGPAVRMCNSCFGVFGAGTRVCP
jgi:superfamily II DNA or RNA helicase